MGQAPFVSVQGQGQVSADNLNTLERTVDNVAALRAFIGTAQNSITLQCYVRGLVNVNDGGQGQFYWNASAVNPVDDNLNTIVPTGSSSGCWSRLTTATNNLIPTVASGTNSIALVPVAGVPTVKAYANYQLFGFTAAGTSTGSVVAQYQSLAQLPVYGPNGIQLGLGGITAGTFYIIAYVSSYNSNAGGFVVVSAIPVSVTPTVVVSPPPQGRLTLVSGTPVMTSDQLAKSTVYYTPYIGNQLPINGTQTSFTEVSATLDTANFLSTNLYDFFIYNDSGTVRIGYGPSWSGPSTRSASISLSAGFWVNTAQITLRYSVSNTTVVSALAATYVGTGYATANGQTAMMFKPSGAAGGTNNFLGLYNAYNRVWTTSLERDNTSSWAYATPTWRAQNNSTSNRITVVDGLGQSSVWTAAQVGSVGGASQSVLIGININSTSSVPNVAGGINSNAMGTMAAVQETYPPSLGLNYYQVVEYATASGTFYSSSIYGVATTSNLHGFMLELEM